VSAHESAYEMVERQLRARGIQDERVLAAMLRVPRHRFVPEDQARFAYADYPLPIGDGQTISQPYIVALMTELLHPDSNKRMLDIGTGSGYQAAILAELAQHVYSIELLPQLCKVAQERLQSLGYTNITLRTGDGYEGWQDYAPYDGLVVACAPPQMPPALVEQLAPGGRLVIPVGHQSSQSLLLIERTDQGITQQTIIPVAFVPLVRPR